MGSSWGGRGGDSNGGSSWGNRGGDGSWGSRYNRGEDSKNNPEKKEQPASYRSGSTRDKANETKGFARLVCT